MPLNPPLEKGDIGGFDLPRFWENPPHPPFTKGGIIIYGQAPNVHTAGYCQPISNMDGPKIPFLFLKYSFYLI